MEVYLVGGAVRDALLEYPVHEQDWVVVGATPEDLLSQGYQQVGRDFPVFLHPESKSEYALARRERKTGPGYHGFVTDFSPDITLGEDLLRRDLTINAMAQSEDGTLPGPLPSHLGDREIEFVPQATIVEIDSGSIHLQNGECILSRAVINATGLRASPLTRLLSEEKDDLGRLSVDNYLRVANQKDVFACGDVASAHVDETHKALMSCQHAMPMGKYAGYNAARDLLSLDLRIYRQADYVTCLDLGSEGAVFTRGWDRQVELTGTEAKTLKRTINTEWIYPPVDDRDLIFEKADIDALSARQKLSGQES